MAPRQRLEDRATWRVSRAYARSSKLLAEAFDTEGSGLRGYHYRLLVALDELGPQGQADLGRSTGIDPSDVANALADLTGQGLVERTTDPHHRRRNIVTITAAGLDRVAALDTVVDGVQDRFLEPLSEAERRQLVKLLGKLSG